MTPMVVSAHTNQLIEEEPMTQTRQMLATTLAKLKKTKQGLEEALVDTNSQIEVTEQDLITVMENEGLEKFTDSEHGTFYIRQDVYASTSDQEALFKWLGENQMTDIIKQQVHPKTLAGIVRDHGMEIPGVRAFIKSKVGIRRSSK